MGVGDRANSHEVSPDWSDGGVIKSLKKNASRN